MAKICKCMYVLIGLINISRCIICIENCRSFYTQYGFKRNGVKLPVLTVSQISVFFQYSRFLIRITRFLISQIIQILVSKKLKIIGKNLKISEKMGKFRKKSEKFGKNWKILEEIGKFRKKSDIFVEKRTAGFLAQRVCQYSFLIFFMIE